ncbi:alpha,alpha-trehalose-phosphate synthase (UDP-forming) [Benzoatithermus flavus]|uniref:Trehalose-6-phosphate synthase n=1 Tax=Benzoatithermus flavus TaxID=3108223 RepID=A0ABU8XTQ5_9PROT
MLRSPAKVPVARGSSARAGDGKSGQKERGGRLVVASNRVSVPTGRQAASAGGLAVGVQAALRDHGGIWFGWSGELVTDPAERQVRTVEKDGITYVLIDLTRTEHRAYYGGMANRTLWPLLHYRIDLTTCEHEWYRTYAAVNRLFAETLMERLRPEDRVWVQDFHLIPLGRELRRLGFAGRLGFFLHVPFPPAQIFLTLPWHHELGQDLCAYDVAGFQTPTDRDHFVDYARRELGAEVLAEDRFRREGRTIEVEAVPIGVDVREVERLTQSAEARRQRDALQASLDGRALIIGVDRLDYSKGIVERLRGYLSLLADYPQHRRKVVLMQISAPSREDLPEYRDMRRTIERLVGHIVGRYAEADWIPLRYLNRTHSRRTLAGFYRLARVGLVTPLRDGLNLVAEEFVVAQDPNDPGVLVLSRFAGAAAYLDGALVVNPYDVGAVAEALDRALTMTLEERQERHRRLLAAVRANDVAAWRRRYLAALEGEHETS